MIDDEVVDEFHGEKRVPIALVLQYINNSSIYLTNRPTLLNSWIAFTEIGPFQDWGIPARVPQALTC